MSSDDKAKERWRMLKYIRSSYKRFLYGFPKHSKFSEQKNRRRTTEWFKPEKNHNLTNNLLKITVPKNGKWIFKYEIMESES